MVKRQSPRILAAAAVAALALGLSSCATPQTLKPYTPAEGVQADVPSTDAVPGANEVPLKIRNLMIVAEPDANQGFLSGAFIAPVDRSDRLVSIEGRTFTHTNTEAGTIQRVQANRELPAGQLVRLTEGGTPLQVSASQLTPGLLAELTLTFEGSKPQTLMVPVVDASKEDYATYSPAPAAGSATPTPAAAGQQTPAEAAPPAEATPGQAPAEAPAQAPAEAAPTPG
ncbi:hypothetical protein AADG42_05340 [Ammonicoccus fulvus]|uniref:Copper chaperone PCu(A)C n=1 Tax=Ammonicoccus fulvus TaxID=3138240 RepID=A0ABZ3FNK0_9ACTN